MDTSLVADHSKKITDSKLYTLAQSRRMLEFLAPSIGIQMSAEAQLNDLFPRSDDDGEDTRILLNYTNAKGQTSLFSLSDHLRLDREFDIDHFMNGFVVEVPFVETGTGKVDAADAALTTALNYAAIASVGLGEVNESSQLLANVVLQAIIALVFNDPLDVMVSLMDLPLKPGETTPTTVMANLWVVKARG